MRVGHWKLVSKYKQPWELYHMEKDRTEMHNLADEKPELVQELASRWDRWAKRSHVYPLRPPRIKKKR